MRSNFIAPELEDGFTDIVFPELPEGESRSAIGNIKHSGSEWARRNPGNRGPEAKSRLENRASDQLPTWGGKGKANWDQKENRSGPYGGGKGGGAGGKGGGG